MNSDEECLIKMVNNEDGRFKPWESEFSPWRSKSEYFTWVRGVFRKAWTTYPVKNNWKSSMLRPITDEDRKKYKWLSKRVKKVGECIYCHELFAASKLQVDHKILIGSCRTFEEANNFAWHCIGENTENMGLTCLPCHKIKSYAESHGMTFEEAATEKYAIKMCKKSAKLQIAELTKRGFTKSDINNAGKRRQCYKKLYKTGK